MKKNKYFAAANGFNGFRSYFKSIFDPSEYTRIYILKGGPGTGKSTLMKKITTSFAGLGLDFDNIFCSSDPKSLDGVIIQNKKIKIALIDGTAPHECDAKYPGAVDEIINLGVAFDKKMLTSYRDRIIELNNLKGQHYASAYANLKFAGISSSQRNEIYENAVFISGEEVANRIFNDIETLKRGRITKNKLLSSFGKDGYCRLNSNLSNDLNKTVVSKESEKCFLLLREIYKYITSSGIEADVYTSPFSDDIIEQIYLPEYKRNVVFNDVLIRDLCDKAFDNTLLNKYDNIIEMHTSRIESALSFAQEEFSKASAAHFALESIYTPAMNFAKIDNITNNIIEEIKSLLT